MSNLASLMVSRYNTWGSDKTLAVTGGCGFSEPTMMVVPLEVSMVMVPCSSPFTCPLGERGRQCEDTPPMLDKGTTTSSPGAPDPEARTVILNGGIVIAG